MTKRPYISIIISTYKSGDALESCLQRLAQQSSDLFEILVVDGGSTDNTDAVIANRRDQVAVYISEPDEGIYDAWNKALPHIHGEWVHFLGTDDALHDNGTLEAVAPMLQTLADDVLIAYGNVIEMNEAGDRTLFKRGECWQAAKANAIQAMMLPHQAVFHRSATFEMFGHFDRALKIAGDYEFLLRIFTRGHEPHYFHDVIVAQHRLGGVSTDPFKTPKVLREVISAQRRHGVPYLGTMAALFKACLKVSVLSALPASIANQLVDRVRAKRGAALPPTRP